MKNDFSYPEACALRFQFAARAGKPEVELFWYDGGIRPRMPEEIATAEFEMPIEGILFVGDKGKIFGGFRGENPVLYRDGKHEPLWAPEPRQRGGERGQRASAERNRIWRDPIRGRGQSPGSFLNATSISDTVNLGTVALRAGKKVLFDSGKMRITNVESANQYLSREYRKGWEPA